MNKKPDGMKLTNSTHAKEVLHVAMYHFQRFETLLDEEPTF